MKYTHRVSGLLIALATVALVSLSPSVSFAKNDRSEKDDDDKKEWKIEKMEDNESRHCLKAFGHLFAPGWIKKNGTLNIIGEECDLPFGIGKKFRGNHSTSTPLVDDVTPPVISDIVVNDRAKMQVTVRWLTDERSDSAVFVSTVSPVNTSSTSSSIRKDFTREHRVVVKNLAPGTTYYGLVRSRDKSGNIATSSQFTFTTKAATPDTNAPAIGNIVTLSGTTTIRVAWHTNEIATSRVYYSTLPLLDLNASTTAFVNSATLVTNHVLALEGLATSTRYYMIIESADPSGNVSLSPSFFASTTPGVSI